MIEKSDGLMALWIELCSKFERAYMTPVDNEFIGRVYDYARWCSRRPPVSDDPGNDPLTCVCCAFFEHVLTIPAARREMYRWFSVADVMASKRVFSHLIGEDDFEKLVAELRAAGPVLAKRK
jgi:hypothetical protein